MQGMMMSERPASIATGMVDSSISIGNYKGVMLCNRPFAGASQVAAAAVGGGPATQTFAAGVVPEALGLNRQRSDVVKVKRTKKETALTRHRKWLADLQNTQTAAEKTFKDEAQAKDDSKHRFMEREAKMRAMTKSVKLEAKELALAERKEEEDASSSSSSSASSSFAVTSAASAEAKGSDDGNRRSASEDKEGGGAAATSVLLDAAAKKRAKNGKASKPMWALTEDKAQEAAQELELDELDDLLDFAKNLDFEKYIGDMELTTMMDQVKKRIAELEKMEEEDYEKFEQSVMRGENKPMSLTADKISALQKKYGVEEDAKDDDDDDDETRSVAMSVLSEHKELGNIHSTASVAALAAKSKATAVALKTMAPFGKDFPENGGGGLNESAVQPPTIAAHTDDQGTRLSNKSSVQNLPYMHRNPSV